jgi:hypothetical protein
MAKFNITAQMQLQAPTNLNAVSKQIKNKLQGIQSTANVKISATSQKALAKYNKKIKDAKKLTDEAKGAMHDFGKSTGLAFKRFAAYAAATAVIYKVTGAIKESVAAAIEFERQMTKVSQVTGRSMQGLAALNKEITFLSTNLGVSSSSLVEVTRVLAQAGLTAADVKVALSALAKTELAPTFDNITNTAETALAILAQFGNEVDKLEGRLGSINAVAGSFAVEASDLGVAIRRAGGAFQAAGGSLEELLALFTAVRSTTRESAETIATGFRTIFTRMRRPSTIKFLDQLGVSLTDLEGNFIGPYKAVEQLHKSLKGLDSRSIKFAGIIEELGGFRQVSKVIPLIKQFEKAQRALAVAQAGSNSLAEDAETAQGSLAVRITKVKESFEGLIRKVSDSSTFGGMATTALKLAQAFISIADALTPLLPLITLFATMKIGQGLGSMLGFKGSGGGITDFFKGAKEAGKQGAGNYSSGGSVRKFARGGVVPGTGNSDTVPAMLQPGEFVIRKSSVNKIGSDNLHKMNSGVQKRKRGGRIQRFSNGDEVQPVAGEYSASIGSPVKPTYAMLSGAKGTSEVEPNKLSVGAGGNKPMVNKVAGILGEDPAKMKNLNLPIDIMRVNPSLKSGSDTVRSAAETAVQSVTKGLGIADAEKPSSDDLKNSKYETWKGNLFEAGLSGAIKDVGIKVGGADDKMDYIGNFDTDIFKKIFGKATEAQWADAKIDTTVDIRKKMRENISKHFLASSDTSMSNHVSKFNNGGKATELPSGMTGKRPLAPPPARRPEKTPEEQASQDARTAARNAKFKAEIDARWAEMMQGLNSADPPAEDMKRLYRVGTKGTGKNIENTHAKGSEAYKRFEAQKSGMGRWYSDNLENAYDYMTYVSMDPKQLWLSTLDVPNDTVEGFRVSNIPLKTNKNRQGLDSTKDIPNNPRALARTPEIEFFVSPEMAASDQIKYYNKGGLTPQQSEPQPPHLAKGKYGNLTKLTARLDTATLELEPNEQSVQQLADYMQSYVGEYGGKGQFDIRGMGADEKKDYAELSGFFGEDESKKPYAQVKASWSGPSQKKKMKFGESTYRFLLNALQANGGYLKSDQTNSGFAAGTYHNLADAEGIGIGRGKTSKTDIAGSRDIHDPSSITPEKYPYKSKRGGQGISNFVLGMGADNPAAEDYKMHDTAAGSWKTIISEMISSFKTMPYEVDKTGYGANPGASPGSENHAKALSRMVQKAYTNQGEEIPSDVKTAVNKILEDFRQPLLLNKGSKAVIDGSKRKRRDPSTVQGQWYAMLRNARFSNLGSDAKIDMEALQERFREKVGIDKSEMDSLITKDMKTQQLNAGGKVQQWVDAINTGGDIGTSLGISKGNLGYDRGTMPQISKAEEGNFLQDLASGDSKTRAGNVLSGLGLAGAKIASKSGSRKASSLTATQKDIYGDNVRSKLEGAFGANWADEGLTNLPEWLSGELMISKDSRILDGHHRWATIMARDLIEDGKIGDHSINTRQIDLPMQQLLQVADPYSGAKAAGAETTVAKLNKGGPSKDTVPALLTPGEFVINKKSAQQIGGSTLSRMNKIGKFNTGGPVGRVQMLAEGGSAGGGDGAMKIMAVMAGVSAMGNTFVDMNSEVGQVMKGLTTFGSQFMLITTILANGANKFSKAADASAAKIEQLNGEYIQTQQAIKKFGTIVKKSKEAVSKSEEGVETSGAALAEAKETSTAASETAAASEANVGLQEQNLTTRLNQRTDAEGERAGAAVRVQDLERRQGLKGDVTGEEDTLREKKAAAAAARRGVGAAGTVEKKGIEDDEKGLAKLKEQAGTKQAEQVAAAEKSLAFQSKPRKDGGLAAEKKRHAEVQKTGTTQEVLRSQAQVERVEKGEASPIQQAKIQAAQQKVDDAKAGGGGSQIQTQIAKAEQNLKDRKEAFVGRTTSNMPLQGETPDVIEAKKVSAAADKEVEDQQKKVDDAKSKLKEGGGFSPKALQKAETKLRQKTKVKEKADENVLKQESKLETDRGHLDKAQGAATAAGEAQAQAQEVHGQAGAGLDADKERVKSAKNIENIAKQEAEAKKKAIEQEKKKHAQAQKSAANAKKFAQAVAGAAAGMGALGGYMSGAANKALELGEEQTELIGGFKMSSEAAAGFGGALQGASSGASTGAMVGGLFGPLGQAIGAGVGMLIGAFMGYQKAAKEARDKLKAVSLEKDIKAATEAVSDAMIPLAMETKKETRARLGAVAASTAQKIAEERMTAQSIEGAKARKDAIKSVNDHAKSTQELVNRIAENATSYDEVKGAIEPMLTELQAAGVNIFTYRESLMQQIEAQQEGKRIQDELNKTLNQQRKRIKVLETLTIGLDRLRVASMDVVVAMEDITAFMEGGVGKTKVVDRSEVFGNVKAFAGTEVLEREINTVAGLLGSGGSAIAEEANTAATAINRLPDILLAAAEEVQKDPANKSLKAEIMQQLQEQLGADIGGTDVGKMIMAKLTATLPGEDDAEALLQEIMASPSAAAEKMGESFGPMFEQFAKAGKMVTDSLNNLAGNLASITSVELQIAQTRAGLAQKELQMQQKVMQIRGQEPKLAQIRVNDIMRQGKVLSGADKALAGNAQAMGNQVRLLQERIAQRVAGLQNMGGVDARQKEIVAIDGMRKRLGGLNAALKLATDVTAQKAAIEAQISKEQQDRQAKSGHIEEATFATNDQRMDMATAGSAATVLASTGNIDSIPEQFRGAAKGFLDKFNDIALPQLGGRTGRQVKTEVTANELSKVLGRPLTKEEFESVFKATDKEKTLIEELERLGREELAAQEQILKSQEAAVRNMESAIIDQNRKFLDELKTILTPDDKTASFDAETIYASSGGLVSGTKYLADGSEGAEKKKLGQGEGLLSRIFKKKGKDSHPAMLADGEFVMNEKATAENKGLLVALNKGTRYLNEGGFVDPNTVASDETLIGLRATGNHDAAEAYLQSLKDGAKPTAKPAKNFPQDTPDAFKHNPSVSMPQEVTGELDGVLRDYAEKALYNAGKHSLHGSDPTQIAAINNTGNMDFKDGKRPPRWQFEKDIAESYTKTKDAIGDGNKVSNLAEKAFMGVAKLTSGAQIGGNNASFFSAIGLSGEGGLMSNEATMKGSLDWASMRERINVLRSMSFNLGNQFKDVDDPSLAGIPGKTIAEAQRAFFLQGRAMKALAESGVGTETTFDYLKLRAKAVEANNAVFGNQFNKSILKDDSWAKENWDAMDDYAGIIAGTKGVTFSSVASDVGMADEQETETGMGGLDQLLKLHKIREQFAGFTTFSTDVQATQKKWFKVEPRLDVPQPEGIDTTSLAGYPEGIFKSMAQAPAHWLATNGFPMLQGILRENKLGGADSEAIVGEKVSGFGNAFGGFLDKQVATVQDQQGASVKHKFNPLSSVGVTIDSLVAGQAAKLGSNTYNPLMGGVDWTSGDMLNTLTKDVQMDGFQGYGGILSGVAGKMRDLSSTYNQSIEDEMQFAGKWLDDYGVANDVSLDNGRGGYSLMKKDVGNLEIDDDIVSVIRKVYSEARAGDGPLFNWGDSAKGKTNYDTVMKDWKTQAGTRTTDKMNAEGNKHKDMFVKYLEGVSTYSKTNLASVDGLQSLYSGFNVRALEEDVDPITGEVVGTKELKRMGQGVGAFDLAEGMAHAALDAKLLGEAQEMEAMKVAAVKASSVDLVDWDSVKDKIKDTPHLMNTRSSVGILGKLIRQDGWQENVFPEVMSLFQSIQAEKDKGFIAQADDTGFAWNNQFVKEWYKSQGNIGGGREAIVESLSGLNTKALAVSQGGVVGKKLHSSVFGANFQSHMDQVMDSTATLMAELSEVDVDAQPAPGVEKKPGPAEQAGIEIKAQKIKAGDPGEMSIWQYHKMPEDQYMKLPWQKKGYLMRQYRFAANQYDEEHAQEFATGGSVSGPGGIDNVPAWLTAGEYVVKKSTVDKYGTGFFESLNQGNLGNIMPGMADGGGFDEANALFQKAALHMAKLEWPKEMQEQDEHVRESKAEGLEVASQFEQDRGASPTAYANEKFKVGEFANIKNKGEFEDNMMYSTKHTGKDGGVRQLGQGKFLKEDYEIRRKADAENKMMADYYTNKAMAMANESAGYNPQADSGGGGAGSGTGFSVSATQIAAAQAQASAGATDTLGGGPQKPKQTATTVDEASSFYANQLTGGGGGGGGGGEAKGPPAGLVKRVNEQVAKLEANKSKIQAALDKSKGAFEARGGGEAGEGLTRIWKQRDAQITALSTSIAAEKAKLVKKNMGGSIFGPGGIDNVPAMLTAGEFVIKKSTVDKFGSGFFNALNGGGQPSVKGGIGQYKDGGMVQDFMPMLNSFLSQWASVNQDLVQKINQAFTQGGGGGGGEGGPDVSGLSAALNAVVQPFGNLANALNTFSSGEASIKIEMPTGIQVDITAPDILGQLGGYIENMIMQKVVSAINNNIEHGDNGSHNYKG